MRSMIIVMFELISLVSLQAQDFASIEYCNDRFLNIEEGLSGLQRHGFSSRGDTLAVIDNDSIFLYDIISKREIAANELPFILDSETKLGGVVDFIGGKLVVFQVYFSTPDTTSIKFAVFNEKLNVIETSKVVCGEYIFLSGFVGRIKLKDENLVMQDYWNNKEELFINKYSGEYCYNEYDRKASYHNRIGFENTSNTTFSYVNRILDNGLIIKNAISFYNYNVAFCENKDNECELVLLESTEHTILDKAYSNYDCSAVKLFDSGFSWFKDGCFYQIVMPQDKMFFKVEN